MIDMRFRWIQTWPGDKQRVEDGHVSNDALNHEQDVMRVFQVVGGPQNNQWFWTTSRLGPPLSDGLRQPLNRDGFCATKEQAQEAAGRAYLS